MQQLKWTERKFDFGFRKEYLPFFIERIKATAPRIEELTRNMDDAVLSQRINDQWSLKEHIGHLTDLEELHEARVQQFAQGLTELHAADMSNKRTHEAGHNEQSIEKLMRDLRGARTHFIEQVMQLDEKKLEHLALHPRLQKQITVTDLVYFVGEHDNHHLTLMALLVEANAH